MDGLEALNINTDQRRKKYKCINMGTVVIDEAFQSDDGCGSMKRQ
jgi:hypothetical protein